MGKSTKILLISAAVLVFIGLMIFAVTMSAIGWDFTMLGTKRFETNSYDVIEEFTGISIDTDTADIVFKVSDNGQCRVECYEFENEKHTVLAKDGILCISVTRSQKWYDYIGINTDSPVITVYIPKKHYESLVIKESTGDVELVDEFDFGHVSVSASTGDINIKNVSTGAIELLVSTGNISVSGVKIAGECKVELSTGKTALTDLSCKTLTSDGNTGDIVLKNVIVAEKLTVTRSTGDVKLDGSDAAEIFITTDTGNVEGSLLSEKVFIVNTDTGDVDVPDTVSGGRCEITTDTGDVEIRIKQ